MAQRKPTDTSNLDIYGDAVLDWDRADKALSNPPSDTQTWFLGTVDPNGRPHATGVGAFYTDGDLYFTSGPGHAEVAQPDGQSRLHHQRGADLHRPRARGCG